VRILTLGVYGFTEETFLAALRAAKPDVFVDTRRRRGVRGRQYAFANAQRLRDHLADLGIRYVHRLDLAPTEAMVKAQGEVDREAGIRRHDRATLSPVLAEGYWERVIDQLDAPALLAELGHPEAPLFFCVEGDPHACHRLLLANEIARQTAAPVENLVPEGIAGASR
jgi:uncharacterized protein (DUF488 family)